MATYTVGQGVQDALTHYNDEARSNESYVEPGVSVTYARDAIYIYYQEDNRVNRLPFER